MASPSLFFTIIFFRGGYVGKPLGKKTAKKKRWYNDFARVGLVSYIIFKIFMFMTNI